MDEKEMQSRSVYIASGWWRPGHLEDLEKLERHLVENDFEFFSPRLSKPQLSPESSPAQREIVFNRNLYEMRSAQMIFARIDDWDPGTVWEMGYAFAHRKRVVAWSMVPGRKLNLMIAEGCEGFVNGWNAVRSFFQPGGGIDWEVAEQWASQVE